MGVATGIDLDKVAIAAREVCAKIGRVPVSRVNAALLARQRRAAG